MSTWPWNSHPVTCLECGHPYTVHEPGGGACTSCGPELCPGFRWIDPTSGIEHQGYEHVPTAS